MAKLYYPAVLERDEDGVFGVRFPDFPGCVAAAVDQQQAIAKAHEALANAVQSVAERDGALPAPTPFEDVETPEDIDVVAIIAVGVTPPNPSERVNVYLPKNLIERIDARAEDMGMSRSSLIGFALSRLLSDDMESRKVWYLAAVESRAGKKRAGGG